jgi:tRNA (guanine-N7-)-methyltransferase
MHLTDPPLSAFPTHRLVQFTPPPDGGVIDWQAAFGNDHPLELEIGSGRGRFLMLASYAHPELNYVGVEYARRYAVEAVERIGKRGLANVRLVHTDAVAFLRDRTADGVFSALHLYFPDPWPKKRHHKRRFVRREVLDQLARITRAGALWRIATDHAGYAAEIERQLELHPDFERLPTDPLDPFWDLPGMGPHSEQGVTNFDIKYRREGRAIVRFVYRRR